MLLEYGVDYILEFLITKENKVAAVKAKAEEVSMEESYNKVLLPPELRKVNQQYDKVVMYVYGIPMKDTTEENVWQNS